MKGYSGKARKSFLQMLGAIALGCCSFLLLIAILALTIVFLQHSQEPRETAAGNVYYVSTSGNDANNGSQTSPFATIQKAASLATPGTTINVAPGTYITPVITNASGTAAERIIYLSDVKWGARIQTTGADMAWTNYGNYVDIVGFNITGSGTRGIMNYGSYVRSMNNYIHNIPAFGCQSGGGITDADYSGHDDDEIGNVIHDIGTGTCNQTHGIYHANRDGHIYNNIIYNSSGYGIHLWHAATNVTIANNLLFENRFGGILIGAGDAPGGVSDDHTIVANNIVMHNHGNPAIFEYGNTGSHNQYLNNIVFANDQGISLQNGNKDVGTLTVDPQFVNYQSDGSGNYHLKSTSPAIDAGTSIGAPTTDINGIPRPQGRRYDIGPYEYQFSSITPTGSSGNSFHYLVLFTGG
jgi:uncharacterized protein DUF1565/parallel beta helix pectate lyase-like protein